MARTFSFDSLGTWPKDLSGQQAYMDRLRAMLIQMTSYVESIAPFVVLLQQATQPTQAEWETAWTTQSLLSLPIPPTADLVWWNTTTSRIGGHFRTVEGDTTVYRREHNWPRGATVALESAHLGTARTINHFIGENPGNFPVLTITLPTTCHLIINGSAAAVLSSGTGFLGMDFLLTYNGGPALKVGDTYFGLPADQGLININASELMTKEIVLEDMPAGVYTVRMILGVTASPVTPPSYLIGGTSGASANGVYQVTARGIAA